MDENDINYLKNYKSGVLYVHPGLDGAFGTILIDSVETVGLIDIKPRIRLAVKAFRLKGSEGFGTFQIVKLKYDSRIKDYVEETGVSLSRIELGQVRELISILATLVGGDAQKTKISLGDIQIESLGTLLGSAQGAELIQKLAATPELHRDIYALASKRKTLAKFKALLAETLSEAAWQAFFEENPWIFGLGLNHVFLEKVSKKMEAVTTGAAFDTSGKRADGLMRTRAEISQYVFIEIKRNDTELLGREYRSGCWSVSPEVAGAVAQVQKTVHEFTKNRFRDEMKDEDGNDLGKYVYAIEPRSYLVVGNQRELVRHSDKIACFELFRRNIRSPEILTFDELYERAKYTVETLDKQA